MPGEGIIQAEVSVQIGSALAELKRITDALAKVGQDAGAGMKPANEAVESYGKTIKEFRREQVGQAKDARFVANTVAEIIPAANGAKEALAGLISIGLEGLSGGISLGLGLEVAAFIGGQLKKVIDAEDEAKKKAAEWGAEMRAQLVSLGDKARDLADEIANITPTQKAARTQSDTKAAVERLEKEKQEILARQRRMEASPLGNEAGFYNRDMGAGRFFGQENQAATDRKRLKEIEEGIEESRTRSLGVLKGEAAELAHIVELEKQKQTAARAKTDEAIRAENALNAANTERQRIEVEYTNQVRAATMEWQDDKLTAVQLEEKINGLWAKRGKAIAEVVREEQNWNYARARAFADSLKQMDLKEVQTRYGRLGNFETDPAGGIVAKAGGKGVSEMFTRASYSEFEKQAERQVKMGEDAKKLGEYWEAVGSAVTNAAGAFSALGAAIGGAAGEMVGKMMEVVIAAVKMAIAIAAASAAEVPVVGWLNAAAAAVSLAATMASVLSGVSARELGGSIGPGMYLVGERGPELLQFGPGSSGAIVPNHALAASSIGGVDRGAAAAPITVNFNAPVDQAWWRSNERHLMRTMREAVRSGR